MISFRFLRRVFCVWYVWWLFTFQGVRGAQGTPYTVRHETRFTGVVLSALQGVGYAECAVLCSKEESCFGFNYGSSGDCELLPEDFLDGYPALAIGWRYGSQHDKGK